MPSKRIPKAVAETPNHAAKSKPLPAIPAVEALSFLRETRGVSTWKVQDMAKSLNIKPADAERVIAVLELQGYVKRAGTDDWMTTSSGEEVSASKTPRYTRERIEDALSSLAKRIAEINRDSRERYKVVEAVAFGDFLSDRARVQAAEVGVHLAPREPGEADSAKEHKTQREFLKQLQGRSSLLHVGPYEKWMSARTHRKLF
jgi:DNA-binding MarR family transcriptional regulator